MESRVQREKSPQLPNQPNQKTMRRMKSAPNTTMRLGRMKADKRALVGQQENKTE